MPSARAVKLKAQCPDAVAGGLTNLVYLADRLAAEVGVRVAADRLIELERITPEARHVVGDLPIAMYHHTSSALRRPELCGCVVAKGILRDQSQRRSAHSRKPLRPRCDPLLKVQCHVR